MNWFEKLTGFPETTYDETRARLEVEGAFLRSRINGQRYRTGVLELASLQELRDRVAPAAPGTQKLTARVIMADVRNEIAARDNQGALFQVASQFNLLEMVSPQVTPEDGVTDYIHDHTQGPACAIAAGAATIFRNYFGPVGDAYGQTAQRQIDTLADLGHALSKRLDVAANELWLMRNGYALPTAKGLARIESLLKQIDQPERDVLRGHLRIGLHHDVEITQAEQPWPIVSQAFCSALPVAYSTLPQEDWREFATLVLEGAYEATLLAAAARMQSGGSNKVFLTLLGGGAFGNRFDWISAAIRRALALCSDYDLNVMLVSYDLPSQGVMDIVNGYRPIQRSS